MSSDVSTPILTDAQRNAAITLLPIFARSTPGFTDLLRNIGVRPSVPPADIVASIALWQAAHPPLVADGVLGPKTAAAIRGLTWEPPDGDSYVLVGAMRKAAPGLRIVPWTAPNGLSFVGHGGWRARMKATVVDLYVLHHDGARSSHSCYQTLLARNYAVHFMLDAPDANGEVIIWQALDALDAAAFHAGPVNERSIGCEHCNPVDPALDDPKRPRPRIPVGWPQYGNAGAVLLGLYPEQIEASILLTETLCGIFGIPRQLPGANGVVAPTVDARVEAGAFAGLCGHGHVTSQKYDPAGAATQLWPRLREAGYGVA